MSSCVGHHGEPAGSLPQLPRSAKEQPAEHETALDPQAQRRRALQQPSLAREEAVEFNPIYGLDLCDMAEFWSYQPHVHQACVVFVRRYSSVAAASNVPEKVHGI